MMTMTDDELIAGTVRDYFEGWFDGDVTRMERALHPDLVKRSPGEEDMHIFTRQQMVELTAAGEGQDEAADRRLEITIADVWDVIASVVVDSAPYREYLHLVRTPAGWKIANALYMPL
jgi:hypothetical protein